MVVDVTQKGGCDVAAEGVRTVAVELRLES
jgi:hypothetical protein